MLIQAKILDSFRDSNDVKCVFLSLLRSLSHFQTTDDCAYSHCKLQKTAQIYLVDLERSLSLQSLQISNGNQLTNLAERKTEQ